MKGYGKEIYIIREVSFTMLVATYTKVNLRMIWRKDLESICMPMVRNISVTGTAISNMDLEKKNGVMGANILAIIKMLIKLDKVNIAGQMEIDMLENGKIICLTVSDYSSGQMTDSS